MKILKYPDPALFKVCAPVNVFGEELKVLLNSMYETMQSHSGLGLAANQVGILYRMFVMHGPNDEKLFLVNPKIVSRGLNAAMLREGCLSAPGEFLTLFERSASVEVEYQDETGAPHKKRFDGIRAVCAQHEIDHLDGKSHLQSKSLSRDDRRRLKKKWGIK